MIEKFEMIDRQIKKICRLKFDCLFSELVNECFDCKYTINDYIERITTGLNPRQNFKLGNGDNFYVTVKNIEDGKLLLNDTCDKINNEALALINKRSRIEKNMILFTGIGSIGRTFFVYENPLNWNISESVFAFKARKNIYPEFLFMVLTSEAFQSYCLNNASGSAQKGIRMEYLKKYPMPMINNEKMKEFSRTILPLIRVSIEYYKKIKNLTIIKEHLLSKYF